MNKTIIAADKGKAQVAQVELANEPVDHRSFGSFEYAIFNNRNKKNKLYRRVVFGYRFMKDGAWQRRKISVAPSQLASLQACIDAARKWLRDK